jgi:hypothetical protein
VVSAGRELFRRLEAGARLSLYTTTRFTVPAKGGGDILHAPPPHTTLADRFCDASGVLTVPGGRGNDDAGARG